MKTTHSCLKQCGAPAWLGALLLAMILGLGQAEAGVSFPLDLKNGTSETVSFTIIPGECYQGTPAGGTPGPVAPGDR